MAWFQYLLEANFYLAINFGVFYFTLRKETFYRLNRWYFIFTTVLSFLLPLINFSWQAVPIQQALVSFNANFATTLPSSSLADISLKVNNTSIFNWENLFQYGYLAVSAFFILKTALGIFNIFRLYRKSEKVNVRGVIHVMLPQQKRVFSFFNLLFYHPSIKANNAIIAHEMVHVEEKHSIDLLFYEIVIALNWFNPLVYKLFSEAKINHEYLADQKALEKTGSKYEYAQLLINYVSEPNFRMGHSMSVPTQLEQRIRHLAYKKSAKSTSIKALIVIPLLAGFFVLSAFTIPKNYAVVIYHFSEQLNAGIESFHPKSVKNSFLKVKPEKKVTAAPTKSDVTKQITIIHEQKETPSELVSRPVAAKNGQRVNALEVMYDWTKNPSNEKIRHVKHSIFAGSEAQLFRGTIADTLYIDKNKYKIKGDEIEVMTEQLMIGKIQQSSGNKKLVLVDAKRRNIITVLSQISIKTKGIIHEVKSIASSTMEDQGNLDLVAYNMRIQYARIDGSNVIIEKEDKNAPYQPSILW